MNWRRALVVVALAVCASSAARAQDPVLTDLYGRGVHLYFGGDVGGAVENFNAAIAGGTRDPRVFYFRGLAYQQAGMSDYAEADFRHAAALETADADRYYDVSRALERIQGNRRVAIERYRVAAKMAAVQHAQQLRRERYQELRSAEPEVTIPVPRRPIPEDAIGEEESETEMPEQPQHEEEPGMEAPAEEPAKSSAEPERDPFADQEEMKPEKPAAPPAEPPAEAPPAEAPPAEAPPAAEPPAAEPPAAADPFGETPGAAAPASNDSAPAEAPPAEAPPQN